jgi:hypothetical protein
MHLADIRFISLQIYSHHRHLFFETELHHDVS